MLETIALSRECVPWAVLLLVVWESREAPRGERACGQDSACLRDSTASPDHPCNLDLRRYRSAELVPFQRVYKLFLCFEPFGISHHRV